MSEANIEEIEDEDNSLNKTLDIDNQRTQTVTNDLIIKGRRKSSLKSRYQKRPSIRNKLILPEQ